MKYLKMLRFLQREMLEHDEWCLRLKLDFVVTFNIFHFVVVTAILDDTAEGDDDETGDEDDAGI